MYKIFHSLGIQLGCGVSRQIDIPDSTSIDSDQQKLVQEEIVDKNEDDQLQNQNLITSLEKNYKHFCLKQNTQPDSNEMKQLYNCIITQETNSQMFKYLSRIVENEIYALNGTTPETAIHLSLQKQYQNVFFSIAKTFMNMQVTSFVSQNQPFNYDYNELVDALLVSSKPQIVIINHSAINFQRLQLVVQKQMLNTSFIQNIVYLDFSNNPLSDSGCILLLAHLNRFQSLKYLILKQTQAQNSTVRVLCEQAETKGLYELDLSENPGISRGSYQELLSLAQSSYNLTKLSLENCGLNHQQLSNLKHLTLRNKICRQLTQDLIENCLKIVLQDAPSDDFQQTQSLPSNKIKKNDILQKLNQQFFKQHIAFEIAEKVTEQHESHHFPCNFDIAASETMGRRKEMEDVQVIIEDFYTFRSRRGGFLHLISSIHPNTIHSVHPYSHNPHYKTQSKEVLICLFDGHGGRSGSEKCAEILPGLLADCLNNILKAAEFISPLQIPENVWEPLFTNVFIQTDEQLKKQEIESGTTAVIVLIIDNLIIQANCGDSRAVLVRNISPNKRTCKLDMTSTSPHLKRSDKHSLEASKSVSTEVEEARRKSTGVPGSTTQDPEEILALEVDQHVTATSDMHSTSFSTYNGAKAGDTNDQAEPNNNNQIKHEQTGQSIEVQAHYPQTDNSKQEMDNSDGVQNTQKINNIRQYKQLNKMITTQNSNQLTIRLSYDHKPSNTEEKARIEEAGGYVTNGRVLGVISVSRSFGDFNFKPLITVVPFVSTYWVSKDDYGLIIGCDGVWDVINDEQCAIIMLNSNNAQASSIKIRDEAYKAESGDNISVVCCKFIKSTK